MEDIGPTREHVQLCLQLVLQAHLHQLDPGLTHQKVVELCRALGMHNMPETHAARLDALQVLAARMLPLIA
jgi:hypothetical protein